MIYEHLKQIIFDLLRCPLQPPDAPAGSHESVLIFRASPSFLAYRLLALYLNLAFVAVFELSAVVAVIAKMRYAGLFIAFLILMFVIGKALLLYITVRLDYDMRYYIITDRSLRIREGVWNIRETTLTFANIQNLSIDQGPLQRVFGIYDLVVETAGGAGAKGAKEGESGSLLHRGVVRGIKSPAELRDQILVYLRAVRSSGLGDQDDHSESAGPGGLPSLGRTGLGPSELAVLRAIADETRAWRRAAGA